MNARTTQSGKPERKSREEKAQEERERVVLDVAGTEREGLDVHHLLDMFEKVRGEKIDDDKLLLS